MAPPSQGLVKKEPHSLNSKVLIYSKVRFTGIIAPNGILTTFHDYPDFTKRNAYLSADIIKQVQFIGVGLNLTDRATFPSPRLRKTHIFVFPILPLFKFPVWTPFSLYKSGEYRRHSICVDHT